MKKVLKNLHIEERDFIPIIWGQSFLWKKTQNNNQTKKRIFEYLKNKKRENICNGKIRTNCPT